MSVKVGSARIDENGNAKGGKAGDQTGKEVSTQVWYLHKKGWRVFRCKDSTRAEKIANDMQYACDNSKIGYNQAQRNSLYNVSKAVNFDCSKVKIKCNTDCSALVRVCCAYAGINLPSFNTTNEGQTLIKSGMFIELLDSKYTTKSDYLKRGDILVTKTQGHTVVVLSNGAKANADDKVKFDKVMVTAKSVFIRKAPDKMSLAIGVGYTGDEFTYVDKIGTFYCILYNGEKAYITEKYTVLVN